MIDDERGVMEDKLVVLRAQIADLHGKVFERENEIKILRKLRHDYEMDVAELAGCAWCLIGAIEHGRKKDLDAAIKDVRLALEELGFDH